MEKLAIVVVAYNRLESLKRLLFSLSNADYFHNDIPLIISIDYSGKNDIYEYVTKFKWEHGEKIIKNYKNRLGLRKHILKCGSYIADYDAIVVLEDDLVVSPAFWNYVCHSVNTYQNNNHIAGISLYSVEWNTNLNYPFIAQESNYDAYFMQRAQSWGQIWMKKSWNEFMIWYEMHSDDNNWDIVPYQISSWPESSWLKFHIKYCIENNKYFVYPYIGLTTCFCEEGVHYKNKTSILQVPIMTHHNKVYNFPIHLNNQDAIVYDIFFERVGLTEYINMDEKDIDIDIYGDSLRVFKKRYLLSSQLLNYKIIRSYGRKMRPHESNIIFKIKGNDIFIYDRFYNLKNCRIYLQNQIKYEYYHKLKGKSFMLLQLFIARVINRIRIK